METPFNRLTPAEAERLDYLTEELGEVLQAIGKIKRHGYNSFDPTDPDHLGNNRNDLERELEDVIKAIVLMQFNGDIRDIVDTDCWDFEYLRNKRYFHHQKK
jgi:NTP pyrophosphatase (non-canonical NTP hydrolase)